MFITRTVCYNIKKVQCTHLFPNTVYSEIRQAKYYNVTLRRVRVTTVAVERQFWLWMSLFLPLLLLLLLLLLKRSISRHLYSLTLKKRVLITRHAMRIHHIVICGLPRSTIFFHIFSLSKDLRINVTEHKMCVLIFSTTFVWNIFHSKKNSAKYDKICTSVFM